MSTCTAASSAAMRPWGSQSQVLSQDEEGYGGPLRATQSQLLFSQTQTQQAGGAAIATYSTQDGSGSAAALWGAGWAPGPNPRRSVPPVPKFEPVGPSITLQATQQGASVSASASQSAYSQSSQLVSDFPVMGKRFKLASHVRSESSLDKLTASNRSRAWKASSQQRVAR